jgi:hypothetical protein
MGTTIGAPSRVLCIAALWLAACTAPAPSTSNTGASDEGSAQASPVTMTQPEPAKSPAPSPEASPPATIVRREGSYEGGTYRYAVPPNWSGGLVMYAHGIQQGFGPTVEEPPISTHILFKGYAWAASSYRDRGSVAHLGMEDTLALKRLFAREVGSRAGPSSTASRWAARSRPLRSRRIPTSTRPAWPNAA